MASLRRKNESRRAVIALVVALVLAMLPGVAGAQTPTTTSAPSTSTSTTEATTTTEPATSTSMPSSTTTTKTTSPRSTIAAAAPQTDSELLNLLREGTDTLENEELDLLDRFVAAQGASNSLSNELSTVNAAMLESQQRLTDAANEVTAADERVRASDVTTAEAHTALEREQVRLRESAVDAYMGGGPRPMVAAQAMISASTLNDLATSRVYANALVDDQQHLVEHFRELRDDVELRSREAETDREAANTARSRLAVQQTELERKQAELATARQRQQDAVDEKVRLLADLEQQRAALSERISAEASGGELGERLKAAQKGQLLPATTTGTMRWPLDSYKLTSPFGNRVHPLYGVVRFHAGLDLAIGSGTPIHAAADGIVFLAESYGGYGNAVVIEHGNGLATLYGHQSQLAVSAGDHVTAGQTIGYVGSTGNSTGPHLHWEVRVFGEPTDPTEYVPR